MKWEKVSCDLCGGTDLKPYLRATTTWEHPGKFDFVKCQKCGLVFLNPRPSFREIGKYYPPETYWGNEDVRKEKKLLQSAAWKKARNERFKTSYQEIFKRFQKPGRILDIGCGTNGFLTAFKEKGWQVLGTDLSPEAARYSEKTYGFKVLVGDLSKLNFGTQKFDVVALNGVLEHLYSPTKSLQKINQLLEKGGLLALMIPNIESFGSLVFRKNSWLLQPPRHLYHFSPQTISLFLKKTNFRLLVINHFNWMHNYYSLFESFRFSFSPRFKKTTRGGLLNSSPRLSLPALVLREVGKAADVVFAWSLANLGALLGRGEQIGVYAEKL